MRYLLISDIHSNLEALKSVLAFVRRKRIDKVACMGDIVGYGANPNQIIEALRKFKKRVVIRGNHDKVAAGVENGEQFNQAALESAMWTRSKLTNGSRRFLQSLPQGPHPVDSLFVLAHGTPFDEDAYIFTDVDAIRSFQCLDGTDLCFFGHSHVACVFTLRGRRLNLKIPQGKATRIRLQPGTRYLINPGSVGQPRDREPTSGFGIYDSVQDSVMLYRIPYPVKKAQTKILNAGLPPALAYRLALGA